MRHRRNPWGRLEWLIPVLTAALAVAAFMLFDSLQPPPVEAEIIEGTTVAVGDQTRVRVRWVDETSTRPIVRTRDVLVPGDFDLTGTVPIRVEGNDAHFQDPGGSDLSPVVVAVTAAVGFALGLVVLGSLRGYGYVRGRDQSASLTPSEVREDRGFYWRT